MYRGGTRHFNKGGGGLKKTDFKTICYKKRFKMKITNMVKRKMARPELEIFCSNIFLPVYNSNIPPSPDLPMMFVRNLNLDFSLIYELVTNN